MLWRNISGASARPSIFVPQQGWARMYVHSLFPGKLFWRMGRQGVQCSPDVCMN